MGVEEEERRVQVGSRRVKWVQVRYIYIERGEGGEEGV